MNKGFTIFELLVATLCVGVLSAILLPALARSREASRRVSCMSNLQQLGMTLRMYSEEEAGALPWSGGQGDASCLNLLFPDYLSDVRVFRCPSSSSHRIGEDLEWRRSRGEAVGPPYDTSVGGEEALRGSYDYFGAYTERPITYPHPSRGIPRIPVMWDIFSGSGKGKSRSRGYSMPNHMHQGNVLLLDGTALCLRGKDWAGRNLPWWVDADALPYMDPSTAAPTRRR